MVTEIEKRLAVIINVPVEDLEVTRITRYTYDQKVGPHYDYYLNNNDPRALTLGQRYKTAVIYLTSLTTSEGGGTYFHKLGLTIQPKKGSVSVFENTDFITGKRYKKSFHESRRIEKIGSEKWVMVYFISNKSTPLGDELDEKE